MKVIVKTQDDLRRFIELIKGRKIIQGKKYVAEFRGLREKRGLDQNALFHIWCRVVEQETGQSADDVKDFIKQKYMPSVTRRIFDEDITTWRTRDLTTAEFGDLLDLFQAWAMDFHGILLLTLEDKNFMEFYETYR